MKEITAAEISRLIEGLRENQKTEHGLSIREEKYLAAMEVAHKLMTKESVSESKGDDSWIGWYGGRCPVSDEKAVDLRFRDGVVAKSVFNASTLWWGCGSGDIDIIAYRVVKNDGAGDD